MKKSESKPDAKTRAFCWSCTLVYPTKIKQPYGAIQMHCQLVAVPSAEITMEGLPAFAVPMKNSIIR